MTGGNCQIRMRFIKKSVKNNCIALFFLCLFLNFHLSVVGSTSIRKF